MALGDDDVRVVIAVEVAHVEGDLGLAADDAHSTVAAEGPVPVAPVECDTALARGDHDVEPAVASKSASRPAWLSNPSVFVWIGLGALRDAAGPFDEQVEVPAVLVADEDVHVAVGLDVADIDEVRLLVLVSRSTAFQDWNNGRDRDRRAAVDRDRVRVRGAEAEHLVVAG